MFYAIPSYSMKERLRTAGKQSLIALTSLLLHFLAILALILGPLVWWQVLPENDVLTFLVAAAPLPPVPVPPLPPVSSSPATPHRPQILTNIGLFAAPREIPQEILPPVEDPEWWAQAGNTVGFPGSMPGEIPRGEGLGEILNFSREPIADQTPPPVPPKPRLKREIQRIGGDVLEGKLLRRITPVYPELARRAGVSGTVILEILVDETGCVRDITLLKGPHLLVNAAKEAVSQWLYSPTVLNGEPVAVKALVTVIFTLR